MADREKVIKAVGEAFDLVHSDFIGTDDFNETEWEQNKADALALLKEQDETIKELQNAYGYLQKQFFEVQDELLKEQEGMLVEYSVFDGIKYGGCPRCNARIDNLVNPKACGYCGQVVKWNA